VDPDHPVLRVHAGHSPRDLHTNALESVHARLRKILKTRGHFPNDDAATRLIGL
jgi:transposase-like protein